VFSQLKINRVSVLVILSPVTIWILPVGAGSTLTVCPEEGSPVKGDSGAICWFQKVWWWFGLLPPRPSDSIKTRVSPFFALSHWRPSSAAEASALSQIIRQLYKQQHAKRLTKRQNGRSIRLRVAILIITSPMDPHNLKIRIYVAVRWPTSTIQSIGSLSTYLRCWDRNFDWRCSRDWSPDPRTVPGISDWSWTALPLTDFHWVRYSKRIAVIHCHTTLPWCP